MNVLIAVVACSLIAWIAWLDRGNVLANANSDALQLTVFYDDFFSGGKLNWVLTPASGAFPDHILAFIAYIAGFRADQHLAIYSVMYYVLIFVCGIYFSQQITKRIYDSIVCSFLTIFIVAFLDHHISLFNWTIVSEAHHGGIIPLALIAFGLVLSSVSRGVSFWRSLFLFLVVGAAVFSDTIAVVQIAAPVVFVMLISIIFKRQREEFLNLGAILFLTISGATIGYLAQSIFNYLSFVSLGPIGRGYVSWNAAFLAFLQNIHYIARDGLGYTLTLIFISGFAISAAQTYFSLIRHRTMPVAPALVFVAASASLLAPLVIGNWFSIAFIRQQLVGYYVPALYGISLFAARSPLITNAFSVATVIACALFLATAGDVSDNGFKDQYVRAATIINSQGPVLVLAEYWDAKPLHLYGAKRICSATSQGDIFPWITNVAWCEPGLLDVANGKGDVWIGGKKADIDVISQERGKPREVRSFDEFRFAIYSAESIANHVKISTCAAIAATGKHQDNSPC